MSLGIENHLASSSVHFDDSHCADNAKNKFDQLLPLEKFHDCFDNLQMKQLMRILK